MTKKFRVQISVKAKQDLIGIWHSIAEQSALRADRFLQKLDSRIDSLVEFPDRGTDRTEVAKNARVLVEGKYLIFYRKTSKDVEVLRVVYGGMDLSSLELN